MSSLSNNDLENLFAELTVSLDKTNFDKIFEKYYKRNIMPTIYVEENDEFAYKVYSRQTKKYKKDIAVSKMTNKPDASFVKSVKKQPGLVASLITIIGGRAFGTPYVAAEHPNYELASFPSYFNILGLLSLNNIKLSKQIVSNLTYQIGHVHTLKPTNRVAHQARTASPVYSSMIREIAHHIPIEDERRKFLELHIKRSILEYNRQWNISESLLENGLNIYPSKKNKEDANITVKLNAMLVNTERNIAHFIDDHTTSKSIVVEDKAYDSSYWFKQSDDRLNMINETLWNEEAQTFYDYNQNNKVHINKDKADFIYGLWSGIASEERAKAMLDSHLDEFTQKGVFCYKKDQSLVATPEQILFWKGLKKYDFIDTLQQYTSNWRNLADSYYAKHNILPQHLDVNKEEPYASNHSWTIAAYALTNNMI